MSTTETTKPTSVAETLRAARALIEDPSRWTKGAFARTERGRKVNPEWKAAVCWCMRGALRAVDGDYEQSARDCLVDALGLSDQSYLSSALFAFNDSHEHADVLAAFDKAIAKAEAAVS